MPGEIHAIVTLADINTVIHTADVDDKFLRVLEFPTDIRPVAGAVVRG